MTAPVPVSYARTDDGIDIAYTVTGNGPRDVVVIHGFTTHLDLVWDQPWHTTWDRRLGEHFRVLTFDKRGTGLSDRSLGSGSIEDRTRDVVAVMDAVGSERASLVGISEGAPLSLSMAAMHPDRVDRIVIYGGFARLAAGPDYPQGVAVDVLEEFARWIGEYWGRGVCFTVFVDSPGDLQDAWAHFERNACTRQVAEAILRGYFQVDVRPLLPSIQAPTLVIHNAGDRLIPVPIGRTIADGIPVAEYREFEGDFHCTSYIERALPRIDAAVEFLLGESGAQRVATTRTLATVLFTDIVGSTERAAEMGDTAWREVLEQHDSRAGMSVDKFGGRVVKTTGDGILALFDGPSRGIECARAIGAALKPLGVAIRAGVHTGEVEERGDDVGGVGVHVAARVMALAEASEVVVSRTVRDLVLGSSFQFDERGRHELKGVPGEWEVFAVGS